MAWRARHVIALPAPQVIGVLQEGHQLVGASGTPDSPIIRVMKPLRIEAAQDLLLGMRQQQLRPLQAIARARQQAAQARHAGDAVSDMRRGSRPCRPAGRRSGGPTGWRGRRSRRRRWSRASRPTARRRIPRAATARSGSKSCLRRWAPALPRGFRCRAGSSVRRPPGPSRTSPPTVVKRRQRPDTISLPSVRSCEARTSDSTWWSCSRSSSSRNSTQSPSVAPRPELRAPPGPRGTSWRTIRTSGNSAATMSPVPSLDASSTTSSSMSGQVCALALRNAWRSRSRRLRVGMMIETLSLKAPSCRSEGQEVETGAPPPLERAESLQSQREGRRDSR